MPIGTLNKTRQDKMEEKTTLFQHTSKHKLEQKLEKRNKKGTKENRTQNKTHENKIIEKRT